jgi:acetyl esterase/lipase
MGARREPTDPSVRCIPSQIDEIPCEWVIAKGADPDLRLLYFHGGGYVSGSGACYLAMVAQVSAAAQCAVFLPDYRLAPEHPFPAALEDCIGSHEWLRCNGPEGPAPAKATFIAGDSAGGGLTLATLLALRDRGLPLPKAGITVSAFADQTLTAESIRSEAQLDPIVDVGVLPEYVNRYVADADVRNPYISPIFGDYTGIPPLLIQAGEHEVIRDDSVQAAAKAEADGADVTLEIWPGMFHVFQSHDPLVLPEVKEAIDHIARFIRAHAGT